MEFRDSPNQTRVRERSERPKAVAAAEPVVVAEAAPVTTASEVKTKRNVLRAELIVWYILGVVEVFLGLRLVLGLLDATGTINRGSGFAKFVYNVADPLTKPFYGLFNTASGGEPGIGVIVTAIIVYGLVGWGIARLLRIGRA